MRLDVGAALPALLLTLLAPASAAAEEPAEEIGEIAEVADVEVEAAARLPPRAPFAPKASYCLRFSGSFSTSYADWTSLKRASAPVVARVAVGVVLAGELAVRLLDLFLRRRLRDAERFVERRHSAIVTRAGRSTWSPSR